MKTRGSFTYKDTTKKLGCSFSHHINGTHKWWITKDGVGFTVYENKNKPIPKGLLNEMFKSSGIDRNDFLKA